MDMMHGYSLNVYYNSVYYISLSGVCLPLFISIYYMYHVSIFLSISHTSDNLLIILLCSSSNLL
jgi:hypothetical protein